jgi:hypothetical protein
MYSTQWVWWILAICASPFVVACVWIKCCGRAMQHERNHTRRELTDVQRIMTISAAAQHGASVASTELEEDSGD